jgi:hypothetical protein
MDNTIMRILNCNQTPGLPVESLGARASSFAARLSPLDGLVARFARRAQFVAVAGAMAMAVSVTGQIDTNGPKEHLKVEEGSVYERVGSENWKLVGAATLEVSVKALQDIYPQVTIAMDPKLAKVPLADLKVRADDPQADLEALRAACGSQFDLDGSRRGLSLFTLTANGYFERAQAAAAGTREIQIFSLAGYLEQRPKDTKLEHMVDELQDVINQTIGDLDGTIPQPRFRFHVDAKLLVVIGTPQAIDVAGKVINALPGQQNQWFQYGGMNGVTSWGGSRGGGHGFTSLVAPVGAYAPVAPVQPAVPAAAFPEAPAVPVTPSLPGSQSK